MPRGRSADPKVSVSLKVLQSTVDHFRAKAKDEPPSRLMAKLLDEAAHPAPRQVTAAQCMHPINRRIAGICMVCGAKP